MKRTFCKVLAAVCLISCLGGNAGAIERPSDTTLIRMEENSLATRATNSFSISLKAKENGAGEKAFSMAAGETVKISATYTPVNASVDIGLIGTDGTFYYANTESGSFEKTFEISKKDDYTLGIRNRSDSTIKITGTVKY